MVEKLRARHYAETMGRPGVLPGFLFGMLFVVHFEGLKSRGRSPDAAATAHLAALENLIPRIMKVNAA